MANGVIMNTYDFATTLAQEPPLALAEADGRIALAAPQAPVLAAHGATSLQEVRQAHLDAFRYALPCAYDKRLAAAIDAAWDDVLAEAAR